MAGLDYAKEKVIEGLRGENFIECVIDPNRKPRVYVQVDMVGEEWNPGEKNVATIILFNETDFPYNCAITGRVKKFNCEAKITSMTYTTLQNEDKITHDGTDFSIQIDLKPGIIYKVETEITPDECTAKGTLILEVDKAPNVVSSGRFHGNVRIKGTEKCPKEGDCGEERNCENGEKPGDQPCLKEKGSYTTDCGCSK